MTDLITGLVVISALNMLTNMFICLVLVMIVERKDAERAKKKRTEEIEYQILKHEEKERGNK